MCGGGGDSDEYILCLYVNPPVIEIILGILSKMVLKEILIYYSLVKIYLNGQK